MGRARPLPETPRNELRDAWEERLKAAQERFGNVVEDRARVLLIHGEPAHVFHSRCLDVVLPLEIWAYSRRNPFSPWTGLDLAALPLWGGAAAEIGWAFMELRRRLGLPAPQFRQVSRVSPAAPPEPWIAAQR